MTTGRDREDEERHATTLRSMVDSPTWDQATVTPDGGRSAEATPPAQIEIPGYQVGDCLGAGGMGTVYRAVQDGTHREVALKLLSFHSERGRLRFEREVELSARLDHPNIARIYASGEHGGVCFYAMQLIDGAPLDLYVREAALDPRGILTLVHSVCLAVHHAHQRGVIHRDLKPDNILVDAAGAPCVLDFGLAKALFDDESGAGEDQLTRDGAITGTPAYMSPEQASGRARDTDTRTDVYAIGAVLYELLTGSLPFRGETTFDMLQAIVAGDAAPPSRLRPGLTRDVDTIVLKALAREPDRRYDTPLALAEDIAAHLEHRPISARPLTAGERVGRWIRRNRLVAALLAIIALGAVALTVGSIAAAVRFKQLADTEQGLRGVAVDALKKAHAARRDAVQARRLAETKEAAATEARYLAEMHLAGDALRQTGGVPRARALLETWKDSPLRGWEWSYLDSATRHTDQDTPKVVVGHPMFAVAESRAGVMAFGLAGPLILLDIESMDVIANSTPHTNKITSLGFDHAGATLISASLDGTVKVWKPGAEQPRQVLRHPAGVAAACISPDGKLVASHGTDAVVRIWTVATGKLLGTIKGDLDGQAPQLAFDRDSRRLAFGGVEENTRFPIRVFDIFTGRELKRLRGLKHRARAIAWRPDGKQLAAGGYGRRAIVWDFETGVALRVLETHRADIRSVAWSADGRLLATAGGDRDVVVWNPRTGRHRALGGHEAAVEALAWSPRGYYLSSVGEGGVARCWDLSRQPARTELTLSAGGPSELSSLDWRPDGGALAASLGFHCRVWGPRLGRARPAPGRLVRWSPDGTTVARVQADHLELRRAGGAPVRVAVDRVSHTRALRWHPSGRRLAALAGSRLALIDGGRVRLAALSRGGSPTSLAWRSDGERLAVGNNQGELELLGPSGDRRALVAVGGGANLALAWHPSRPRLAVGCEDSAVRLYDDVRGAPAMLRGHTQAVTALAWHPDGSRLASASRDRRVAIWDADRRRSVLWLRCEQPVLAVAWSADGARLAALTERGTVVVWDSVRRLKK